MWNFTTDMLKQLAINSKKPLILLPQTYGPYKNFLLKKWAEQLVKECHMASVGKRMPYGIFKRHSVG